MVDDPTVPETLGELMFAVKEMETKLGELVDKVGKLASECNCKLQRLDDKVGTLASNSIHALRKLDEKVEKLDDKIGKLGSNIEKANTNMINLLEDQRRHVHEHEGGCMLQQERQSLLAQWLQRGKGLHKQSCTRLLSEWHG